MENRFGVKDFFLFVALGILIVLVILAMLQFDRQYEQVLTVKSQNDQLASEVARIKRQISELSTGVVISGTPTTRPAGRSGTDAFTHLEAAESKPGFVRGGTFVANFATKIGRVTPLISQDVYSYWVQNQVLEALVDRDPYTMEHVPRIAKSWDISPDGLTMRFYLRDDVTFSDGHPMTADDVIFSFDWVRNPEVNAPRARAYMTMLKEVKKIDNYAVEFVFSEPYYLNFETAATSAILPKHFYSRFTATQFNEKVGLLMGSGPYMLQNPENWAPGNGVRLVRNPRYWGVPSTFDQIVFHEVEEEAAQQVLYGNQEHDVIWRSTPEVYEKLINDPRVMSFSNNFRVKTPYSGYMYIGWNQKRKVDNRDVVMPFADKRVRQAMTMLVDRERLAKEIFLGYATVATGPFAPTGPQSDPTIKPWPYDPERGKRLLAEAGFRDVNGDGLLDGPDGQPFKFKLSYPGGSEIYEKIILFLRDNFARGGVNMEPERLDWPVLVQNLTQSNFDACILGWGGVPESDSYQIFHSTQIKDQADNRTSYSNPEVDRAIEQARRTMDHAKRMEGWHQVHRILHEDQPYTFLTNRDDLRLFNKRIHNIEPARIGLNFEFINGNMIPWFIPKDQQRVAQ